MSVEHGHIRRCTRSRMHPLSTGTHDYRTGMILLRAQRHTRRSRYSRSSLHRNTHACALFHCAAPPATASKRARGAFFFFRVPTLFSAGRFSFPLAAHCAASAYRHARARSVLRHAALRRACAHTHAFTHAHGRPGRPTAANDATRGPPAWLTGRLHGGGHGAYAHRLCGPLSSWPLSPRPSKAAAPKGPAFFVS